MNKILFLSNGDVNVECEVGIKVLINRANGETTVSFVWEEFANETKKSILVGFLGVPSSKLAALKAIREASKGAAEYPFADHLNTSVMSLGAAKNLVDAASFDSSQQFHCGTLAQAQEVVSVTEHTRVPCTYCVKWLKSFMGIW